MSGAADGVRGPTRRARLWPRGCGPAPVAGHHWTADRKSAHSPMSAAPIGGAGAERGTGSRSSMPPPCARAPAPRSAPGTGNPRRESLALDANETVRPQIFPNPVLYREMGDWLFLLAPTWRPWGAREAQRAAAAEAGADRRRRRLTWPLMGSDAARRVPRRNRQIGHVWAIQVVGIRRSLRPNRRGAHIGTARLRADGQPPSHKGPARRDRIQVA